MDEAFLAKIKIEQTTEELCIKQLSGELYRMEETSVFNPDLGLGVVVKLRLCENNEYEVVEVVEQSSFVSYDWMLSSSFVHSDEFELLKKKIGEYGGTWEQIMSGVFIAHIPKEKNKGFLKDMAENKILIKEKSWWGRIKSSLFGSK